MLVPGAKVNFSEKLMDPLTVPKDLVGKNSPIPVEILPDNDSLINRFADDLLREYLAAKTAGREKVVFILPVGPVGQYDLLAARCNREKISLRDLIVINMDEYLTIDGRDFIPVNDPLSFRRHMEEHFYRHLNSQLAPPEEHRIFPHPLALSRIPEIIAGFGGCDACFGGIGITGHVAFNDPPEPGEKISLKKFRNLPTRVVRLSRETRLINAVTACRGNIDRIPELAVTVGMKEILKSRKVRIYLNRLWQSAIVRKILYGPVTPAVPGSLLQDHPDVRFVLTDYVAELPEPELK
jgi:glucosamine-6-phosphate deaminase